MPDDGVASPYSASSKALKVLGHRAPRGFLASKESYEALNTELHKHLMTVHLLQPSSLSGTIMDYSQNVGATCEDKDLADYNRVRFMVAMFQPQLLCSAFRAPCKDCNREAECHPWKRVLKTRCLKRHPLQEVPSSGLAECSSCNCQSELPMYVCAECRWSLCPTCRSQGSACMKFVPKPPSKSPVCVCGFPESAHPVEQDSDFVCLCDSLNGNFQCVLSTIKTYIENGLREVVWALCERLKLATNNVEKVMQRWLLHLLYILASATSNPAFPGCAGFRNLEISIQPAADKFIIATSNRYENTRAIMTKAREDVLSFCKALANVLKNEIAFPELDATADVASQDALVTSYWQLMTEPDNYSIICQVDKARALFAGFFAWEARIPTLTTFSNCIALFVGAHRAAKTLPRPVLEALVELMVGDRVKVLMVLDVNSRVPESSSRLFIPRIREGWLVPHIFDSLEAASDDLAFEILTELQKYLTRTNTSSTPLSDGVGSNLPLGPKNKLNLGEVSDFLIGKFALFGRGLLCSSLLLQYVVHMCQALVINPRSTELVTADAEAWLCVLNYVTSGLKKEETPPLTNTHRSSLYQLIHNHSPPNLVSQELFLDSNAIDAAFPDEKQAEGDWNRLRMLVNTLCPLTCIYLPNGTAAWYECKCARNHSCLLFTAKSLISHGAFNVLLELAKTADNTVQLWLLQAVWCLVCAVANPHFPLCPGKSFLRLFMHSCHASSDMAETPRKSAQSSLLMSPALPPDYVRVHDLMFFVSIEAKAGTRTVRKNYGELRAFCEVTMELLPSFHWPSLPHLPKEPISQSHPDIEYVKLGFTQILEMLNHADIYRALCSIEAARDLFFRFWQIDCDLVTTSQTVFGQCISEVLSHYQTEKNLPRNVMEMLILFMSGSPPQPSAEIVRSFPFQWPRVSLSVVQVKEPWVLPYVFQAVSLCSPPLAMEVLRELDVRLVAQAKQCMRIAKEPQFQSCFLPILFEQVEPPTEVVQTSESGELQGSHFAERLQLSTHLIASVHATLIMRYDAGSEDAKQLPHPVETLARGIVMICNHSGRGQKKVPWSRNLMLVRNFVGCILAKLSSGIHCFCTTVHHPAWNHIFDVINIYRNLVSCEMSSNLGKVQLDALMKWLLNPGVGVVSGFEQQVLPEPVVVMMNEFLKQLHFFDLDANGAESAEDMVRVRALQGAGLAFMAFFKECLTVMRGSLPQERDRVMRHFYSSYRFSRAFVKEDLERLKAIEDNDARRRHTMLKEALVQDKGRTSESSEAQEALKQRKRDFQLLDAGTTVFGLSAQLGTCHLYLKTKAVDGDFKKNKLEPDKKFSLRTALTKTKETDGIIIVLEVDQKKISLVLFDEVKLTLGSSLKPELGELEHTRDRCITLRWVRKKKELELGCASKEDFSCWVRILAHLAWATNCSESMGSPVDTEMFLANRPIVSHSPAPKFGRSSVGPPSPAPSNAVLASSTPIASPPPTCVASSSSSSAASSFLSSSPSSLSISSSISISPLPSPLSSPRNSHSLADSGDMRARTSGAFHPPSPKNDPKSSVTLVNNGPITWGMITGKK